MKPLNTFIAEFGCIEEWNKYSACFEIRKLRQKYFLLSQSDKQLFEKIKKVNKLMPDHIGIFLGEMKGTFKPSTSLLKIISSMSNNKIYLGKKAEWLFLCGRDVFSSSIEKTSGNVAPKALILVQNMLDESIGYGVVRNALTEMTGIKGQDIAVQNLLDLGEFLRRERSKSLLRNNNNNKILTKQKFK